jgi:hypothetical protein
MQGSCTSKSAKLAKYASGGRVAVAGHSRTTKKTNRFADGGVVDDLSVSGDAARSRPDRAARGAKQSVTNITIALPEKQAPMLPPPVAAAPMPMPQMPPAAGPMMPPGPGGAPLFKRGGVVKKPAKAKGPIKRQYGGMIPGLNMPTLGEPTPPPDGRGPDLGLPIVGPPMTLEEPRLTNPVIGGGQEPAVMAGQAPPPPLIGSARQAINPLAGAYRQSLRGQGLTGDELKAAMHSAGASGAFRAPPPLARVAPPIGSPIPGQPQRGVPLPGGQTPIVDPRQGFAGGSSSMVNRGRPQVSNRPFAEPMGLKRGGRAKPGKAIPPVPKGAKGGSNAAKR